MISLYVMPAGGMPFERTLEGDDQVIGRSPAADLVIPDRSLSRRHARLFRQNGHWLLEDLGSRNGTLVNEQKVEVSRVVAEGDVITLGASSVAVRRLAAGSSEIGGSSSQWGEHTVFRPAAELLERSEPSQAPPPAAEGEALRRYAERIKMLNEVHQALGRSVALDELLDLILERAFQQLHPEEGAIFLRNDDGEYECAASRSRRGSHHRCLYSRHLIGEVADKGMAALVLDMEVDERFNQAVSMLNAGVRSLVAAPLLDPEGALGMVVLGSTLAVRQFGEEDMELLTSLASVAAMRIRNLRLTEAAAERLRLEREVALAREIQMRLLPQSLPDVPGYELHGGNTPSRVVSGDFFKVIERGDGSECVLFLADVSGKGMGAALLTGFLEALLSGLLERPLGPDETCAAASRLMFERTPPEKYATGFLALLDTTTGTVRYANAGHNPALLIRADGSTVWLESTGTPLGIIEDGRYEAREVTLEPGDVLILYTDGITEAANHDDEEFGEERLLAACVRHRELPLAGIAAELGSELDRFADGVAFADDRTLVMIRRSS